jgi:hypothetical protein
LGGSPMETLVETDSRWTARPSWLCVTPMIMGIPPLQDRLPVGSSPGKRIQTAIHLSK